MKKVICLLLVCFMLIGNACAAGMDLSGLSFDELVALKEQINLAIWQCEEWQEVTVPQGVWQIGKDIPVGHWTIRMADNISWNSWCGLTIATKLDESGRDAPYDSRILYQQLSKIGVEYPAPTEVDIDFKEGWYLIIENNDVIFSPYTGKPSLGFK